MSDTQYRGAPLGKVGQDAPANFAGRFTLRHVPLNSGGYEADGTYWGLGSPLYFYSSDCGEATGYFRVDRGMISAAFKARGGVPIGEPGYDEFSRRYPHWSRVGTREAAKDYVLALFPNARFYR